MIFPELLKHGDKIVIVAPAGKLTTNSLDYAIETMTAWGLQVILGNHVYDRKNYFAGEDEDRIADIQDALDDPSVKAVLCARGGYGVTRILDRINLKSVARNPKWVIGFSDITALHLKLENHSVASIHGPMGTSFSNGSNNMGVDSLKELLFNGVSKLIANEPGIKVGSATATITGGNLSLIIDSLGTREEIDTDNKILFIEEVGEKTYKIDRMFQQLLRAGKLGNLAGLVIGHFSEIDDSSSPFGESWRQVIINITQSFSYPIGFGFSIGHEPENMAIVMAGSYQLKVDTDSSILVWQDPA